MVKAVDVRPKQTKTCTWHGENSQCYTLKNGKPGTCVDCQKDSSAKYKKANAAIISAKNKLYAAANVEKKRAYYNDNVAKHKERALQNSTMTCDRHPGCTWWDTAGQRCGYCRAEFSCIDHATDKDSRKGLKCTMTHDYFCQNIGANCAICGYGPLTPQQEANHPRQLSLDRIDNSKPHDCDPMQTQAVCNQCNAGKWIYTVDEFFVYLHGINRGERDEVDGIVVSDLEDMTRLKRKLGRKKNCTITYDDAVLQLRAQGHCCSLCNLSLSSKDYTFDRTIAGDKYVAGYFTFMHRGCNLFKGEWSVDEAVETARRAVAFRSTTTTTTSSIPSGDDD